jgi:hypothetical protein
MGKIRATDLVQDQLVEEHQKLMIEMRELLRELRACVEETRKSVSTSKPREWSRTHLSN